MLLYNDEADRSSAEIACINKALAEGQYCVYATFDANEKDFVAMLARRIRNYDSQTREGHLKVINFKPFYDSAAKGDLAPFKKLRTEIEQSLKNRAKSGMKEKTLIVADAACNMSRNKQFEECVTLERWWQDTYNEWKSSNLDITIICAHPSSVLRQKSFELEEARISNVHSLTLDLAQFILTAKDNQKTRSNLLPLRILIVEPEPDIRAVYRGYFKSLPVELVMIENGLDCLEKTIMSGPNRQEYDLIIMDTHIKDTSALRIAKKILEERPDQQIVFTSTWNISTFESELESHSLDPANYKVVQKPFQFSHLLQHIRPGKFRLYP